MDVKRLVVAALFVPLLLFSFFSVHTMPRFSDQGMQIVICTGTGVETVSVDNDGGPSEPPAHSPCDWSMQVQLAALPAPVAPLGHVEISTAVIRVFEAISLRPQDSNPGRFARAPPLSV